LTKKRRFKIINQEILLIQQAFRNHLPRTKSIIQTEQIEFTELQLKDLKEKAKEIEVYNTNYIIKNINNKNTSWISLSESVLFCLDFLSSLKIFKKDLKKKLKNYLENFKDLKELNTLVKDYREESWTRQRTESKIKKLIEDKQDKLNNLINFTLSIKKLEPRIKEEKEEKWKTLPKFIPEKKRRKRKTHSI